MEETGFPIATLVMPEQNGLDPAPYLEDACNILADHEGVPVRLIKDRVIGEDYIITVRCDSDGDFGPSVELTVLGLDGLPATGDEPQWILAQLVVTAMKHSPFDLISWVEGEDFLDRETFEQFAAAAGVREWSIENQLRGFRDELKEPETPESPESSEDAATFVKSNKDRSAAASRMGAAGWLMTGALSAVSMPIAVALAVFSAVRGMEFRLATQVVSITVLFVTLSNTEILTRFVRSVLF